MGIGERLNSPKVHSFTDFSTELIDKAVLHETSECLQRFGKQRTSLKHAMSCADRENIVFFVEKCVIKTQHQLSSLYLYEKIW